MSWVAARRHKNVHHVLVICCCCFNLEFCLFLFVTAIGSACQIILREYLRRLHTKYIVLNGNGTARWWRHMMNIDRDFERIFCFSTVFVSAWSTPSRHVYSYMCVCFISSNNNNCQWMPSKLTHTLFIHIFWHFGIISGCFKKKLTLCRAC